MVSSHKFSLVHIFPSVIKAGNILVYLFQNYTGSIVNVATGFTNVCWQFNACSVRLLRLEEKVTLLSVCIDYDVLALVALGSYSGSTCIHFSVNVGLHPDLFAEIYWIKTWSTFAKYYANLSSKWICQGYRIVNYVGNDWVNWFFIFRFPVTCVSTALPYWYVRVIADWVDAGFGKWLLLDKCSIYMRWRSQVGTRWSTPCSWLRGFTWGPHPLLWTHLCWPIAENCQQMICNKVGSEMQRYLCQPCTT